MFEQPNEEMIDILESAEKREKRLLAEALESLITVDERMFRQGFIKRLFDKDVFLMVGIWLGMFWASFFGGFMFCLWMR